MVHWLTSFASSPLQLPPLGDISVALSLARALASSHPSHSTRILEDSLNLPWHSPNAPHLTSKEASLVVSPRTCIVSTLIEINGPSYAITRLPHWKRIGDNNVSSLFVRAVYALTDSNQISEPLLSKFADVKDKILYWQQVRRHFLSDRREIEKLVLRVAQTKVPVEVINYLLNCKPNDPILEDHPNLFHIARQCNIPEAIVKGGLSWFSSPNERDHLDTFQVIKQAATPEQWKQIREKMLSFLLQEENEGKISWSNSAFNLLAQEGHIKEAKTKFQKLKHTLPLFDVMPLLFDFD